MKVIANMAAGNSFVEATDNPGEYELQFTAEGHKGRAAVEYDGKNGLKRRSNRRRLAEFLRRPYAHPDVSIMSLDRDI